ncbi:MAG: hypothetical protein EON93_03460 [Burkholderiales bacterium]|nr:MAG: hypothetical protein EON93_03460 [Burkholderiales bacterium]
MKTIAENAIDEALVKAEIPKSGLFVMGHPSSIDTGKCVWEYAWHKPGEEVPSVKARAFVDVLTGAVQVEVHPDGAEPWSRKTDSA